MANQGAPPNFISSRQLEETITDQSLRSTSAIVDLERFDQWPLFDI